MRQFRVPREAVRAGIAAVLLLLSALLSFTTGFFVKESKRLRAEQLARKNELLVTEVREIRERMGQLQRALDELSKKDEHYRLLAGLDPIGEDVQQAGIGGPGMATLQASALWRVDPEQGELTFATARDLNTMIRRARLLSTSWREAVDSLERTHDRLMALPSIQPTRGYFSSAFSRRRWHPILDRPRPHEGVDITAPRGTPILATARGRVSFVGRSGDYGLLIELDHGYGYVTRYAHAARATVRKGQVVQRGEKIGEVGSTGLATAPHLHYEVLRNGRPVNPSSFILDDGAIPD